MYLLDRQFKSTLSSQLNGALVGAPCQQGSKWHVLPGLNKLDPADVALHFNPADVRDIDLQQPALASARSGTVKGPDYFRFEVTKSSRDEPTLLVWD